jgi:acetyl-CoA carboxylase biotin carboxyl carrier protein
MIQAPIAPLPALSAGPSAGAGSAAAHPGAAAPAGDDESRLVRITSPMVGTFYASAKPGEKPFVAVGSEVSDETDVCLIEAMKNYMPVQAGCRGTIAKVLLQDGQPVQFGTTLFLVKPS